MKLFLDQDVYAITIRFLQSLNHNILTAAESGNARTPDIDLLKLAQSQGRILITRDRDFGSLVFLSQINAGVIYLRMSTSNQDAIHDELAHVLQTYPEEELCNAFVVIEAGRHRYRKLPT
ncbi:MAG: putative nuclease of putative toxin-antitoxin system [Candidatus Latescibacterota bacterium]|jgi:predicted nuclease of predicted toxin-antitoxin system